jgi:hypothetical protein
LESVTRTVLVTVTAEEFRNRHLYRNWKGRRLNRRGECRLDVRELDRRSKGSGERFRIVNACSLQTATMLPGRVQPVNSRLALDDIGLRRVFEIGDTVGLHLASLRPGAEV